MPRREVGLIGVGLAILVVGVVMLLNNLGVTEIDSGRVAGSFLSAAVGIAGVSIIVNARRIQAGMASWQRVLGDVKIGRRAWVAKDVRIQTGIGDVRIDLTTAEIPEGEHHIQVAGWIGDMGILVPQDLALSAEGSVWIGSVTFLGRKRDGFFVTSSYTSPEYHEAPRRVRIEASLLIGDLKIRQAR